MTLPCRMRAANAAAARLLPLILAAYAGAAVRAGALWANSSTPLWLEAGNATLSSWDDADASASPTAASATAATTPEPEIQVVAARLQSARLPCGLASLGGSQRWFRGPPPGTAVPLPQPPRLQLEDAHLRLASVLPADAGLWRCERTDPRTGALLASPPPVRLLLAEPPRSLRLTVDGSAWNGSLPWLQLEEGAPLRLGCEAEGGVPAPQLTWWLRPAPQPLATLPGHPDQADARAAVPLASTTTAAGARLAVIEAAGRALHNATASCLARHLALRRPLRADIAIRVLYSPSFAISRLPDFGFPLREGMAVSLKCDVDANPPSSPKWLRDGEEPPVAQTGDGFLNFSSVRRDHSGWYKCTSRGASSIGYFLNVRASDPAEEEAVGGSTASPGSSGGVGGPSAPRGSVERHLEVPLGSTVTLQCPGGGASCWSRLGSPPEPVGAGPDLTIERVLYQEAGAYRCESALHDATHLTVNLSVRGVPVVYPPWRNLTALAGLPVTLDVEFCANPAANRVLWLLLRGQLLRPGETAPGVVAHNLTEASSPHCQYASLTLTSAQPEDAGEYVLLVRSARGLAEGAFSLHVAPPAADNAPAPAPAPSPALLWLWLLPAMVAAFRRVS